MEFAFLLMAVETQADHPPAKLFKVLCLDTVTSAKKLIQLVPLICGFST